MYAPRSEDKQIFGSEPCPKGRFIDLIDLPTRFSFPRKPPKGVSINYDGNQLGLTKFQRYYITTYAYEVNLLLLKGHIAIRIVEGGSKFFKISVYVVYGCPQSTDVRTGER